MATSCLSRDLMLRELFFFWCLCRKATWEDTQQPPGSHCLTSLTTRSLEARVFQGPTLTHLPVSHNESQNVCRKPNVS